MSKNKFDFSGYATKNGLVCSDGRVILKDAFKHQDKQKVPLVWGHMRKSPEQVLGHALLENRDDGVYCYGVFNDTVSGQNAKALVEHGDITSLSIYANELKERGKQVVHGIIREVSLVLAGANPGAQIQNIAFQHGDGSFVEDETEAIIHTGFEFDNDLEPSVQHAADEDRTISDVFNTLNEEQKAVVYAMLAHALSLAEGEEMEHDDMLPIIEDIFLNVLDEGQQLDFISSIAHAIEDSGEEGSLKHLNKEGVSIMKNNVFDQNSHPSENALTHEQMAEILSSGKRYGSLKESFLAHAAEYGLDPIEVLFPDARNVNPGGPLTVEREKSWVAGVLADTTHTPFSRIKTITADLTVDEARARGYITGNRKNEEVIPLLKRVTTPTTIYKKQKLDRDDISDITDFDVVVWLKGEMRKMLDEEIARAILIGDGRDISDEEKINEQSIRPIALDNDDVYVHRSKIVADRKVDDIIDDIIRARQHYRGSGVPVFYTSTTLLTEMLLVKDAMGRRIYNNVTDLASVLRVSRIVEVELINNAVRKDGENTYDILGIVVNLRDYTIGADRGGAIAMFDDFDIDYNQHKYLIETRISGALTRPKAALVFEKIKEASPAQG